ncbi:PhnB protein [Paenibacillus turicensis]|uniref:PhnB protein n=1 Tax=Paenibacillus turicensis TaxID=160487 RepID=A0ABS4FX52_9BACL|nr:VOC family protein [Paenibacillus turicensis]MBP1907049.1 PhnB protein [Paenibacillus turicensis]
MIEPYLSFNGDCEEAFLWYEAIFNGEIQYMSKFMLQHGDIPEHSITPTSSEYQTKVMHAQLKLTDNGTISGADVTYPIETGNRVSIHVYLPNEQFAQKVISALSEDGIILSELSTNPPPDEDGKSGSVIDKYGFTWIITTMKSTV